MSGVTSLADGATLVEGKWVRIGQRPGPIMYARDGMRIERWTTSSASCFANKWRCWDVVRNIPPHVTAETTFHPTLAAAMAHGDAIVDGLAQARAKRRGGAPQAAEAGPEWDYEPLDLNDANDWQVEP